MNKIADILLFTLAIIIIILIVVLLILKNNKLDKQYSLSKIKIYPMITIR